LPPNKTTVTTKEVINSIESKEIEEVISKQACQEIQKKNKKR
jgi:hypothetical protein